MLVLHPNPAIVCKTRIDELRQAYIDHNLGREEYFEAAIDEILECLYKLAK